MNQFTTVNEDGEVIGTAMAIQDTSLAIALSRAEVDQQVATAKAFPRNETAIYKAVMVAATISEETAARCFYGLKRKGKDGKDVIIDGPSIRLAEIVAQKFGNCRIGSRITHVDRTEKYVEAEGVFHDLETNMATKAVFRRSIATSKGGVFSNDMITVTGNAACSIALRNAIFRAVPDYLYQEAFEEAKETAKGPAGKLPETRAKVIKAFEAFGLSAEQILAILDVPTVERITLDMIPPLRGMFSALKSGETTVEDLLGKVASQHEQVADPLASKKKDAAPAKETPKEPAKEEARPSELNVTELLDKFDEQCLGATSDAVVNQFFEEMMQPVAQQLGKVGYDAAMQIVDKHMERLSR